VAGGITRKSSLERASGIACIIGVEPGNGKICEVHKAQAKEMQAWWSKTYVANVSFYKYFFFIL
jgi:hypothetical protein